MLADWHTKVFDFLMSRVAEKVLANPGMISIVKKEAFYLTVFLWLSWSLGLLAASHGHSPFPLWFS